jgi:Protein of unknown function (DUF3467)
MTQGSNGPAETRFAIEISPEVEGGVYASFASIWHDRDGFTLDFAAITGQPRPQQDTQDGRVFLHVPARIVSRVHLPPSQVFEIMKALEQQLSAWEREQGQTLPRPVEE